MNLVAYGLIVIAVRNVVVIVVGDAAAVVDVVIVGVVSFIYDC